MAELVALSLAPSSWLQIFQGCLALLQGPHDRSRLPACQLLQNLSALPEQLPRLESAVPSLLLAIAGKHPGWAGQKKLQHSAVLTLRTLLEPSEFEPESVKQVNVANTLNQHSNMNIPLARCQK
jgi:hypothetical protein